jgi:DNA polymerase III subunit chi
VTQVDFYILSGASDDALLKLASRIAEKAVAHGQQVHLNAASQSQAAMLDEVLWTFSQSSFLPHRVVAATPTDSMPAEPVLIGAGIEITSGPWNTLINLAHPVPEFFSRYERVAEVVDGDSERLTRGRERYRYYRDRGYELRTHNLNS